jgi:thiol-disulfide isomerase/thioredoxin
MGNRIFNFQFSLLKLTSAQWNVLIVAVLIVGAAWTAASRVTAGLPTRERVRSAPPDFTLDTLAGDKFTLSAQAGRPVVVNFWATWCPPCRAELPAFEEVYRNYRDKGLVVVGVDVAESPEVVAQYVAEAGLTFPIALDVSGHASELFRLQGMPTTLFVGRDGAIRDVIVGGPLSQATIESKVAELFR